MMLLLLLLLLMRACANFICRDLTGMWMVLPTDLLTRFVIIVIVVVVDLLICVNVLSWSKHTLVVSKHREISSEISGAVTGNPFRLVHCLLLLLLYSVVNYLLIAFATSIDVACFLLFLFLYFLTCIISNKRMTLWPKQLEWRYTRVRIFQEISSFDTLHTARGEQHRKEQGVAFKRRRGGFAKVLDCCYYSILLPLLLVFRCCCCVVLLLQLLILIYRHYSYILAHNQQFFNQLFQLFRLESEVVSTKVNQLFLNLLCIIVVVMRIFVIIVVIFIHVIVCYNYSLCWL
jgi:hypothetical protein